MLVKLKPLKWFQENAFKDHDGDYWETESNKDHFDTFHIKSPNTNTYAMNPYNIENGFMEYDPHIAKIQSWAIEKELTKENDPEYFLIQ